MSSKGTAAPFLQVGDKYVLMAVESTRVRSGTPFPQTFSPTFQVVNSLPFQPADHWKEGLGKILMRRLSHCNVIAVCREPSKPGDQDNLDGLKDQAQFFWYGLMFTGMPPSQGIHVLSGIIKGDGSDLHQHFDEPFIVNKSMPSVIVDESKLKRAYEVAQGIGAMFAAKDIAMRLKRGYHSLLSALKTHFFEDRLHLMVRAMDAIVKTPALGGRAKFSHRCNTTFLEGRQDTLQVLRDIYDLRCCIEHQNDFEHLPKDIADAEERGEARERRIRQLEVLVLAVYCRIVVDPSLRALLSSDSLIDAFWLKKDHERRSIWAEKYDLMGVK